jgi:hypothetical protein
MNETSLAHTGEDTSSEQAEVATIRPFELVDPVTGDMIAVSLSPFYSTITVNQREYLFVRETGEFDGVATTFHLGPTAV